MLRWLLASLLVFLAGCAVSPLDGALSGWEGKNIPPVDTPFFPQEAYQCGPAALASVLVQSGVDTRPDLLVPQVYLPGREGSLAIELIAATRRQGRVPLVVQDGLSGLLSLLEQGKPVLVFQNLGLSWVPRWHYAVVTGWDGQSHEFILHSGQQASTRLQLTPFVNTWGRANHWAMVVYKPGELPVSASYLPAYLQELSRLERLGFIQEAKLGYQALLPRMPESPLPGFALGNLAYAAHTPQLAEHYWREVLQRHPQHAPSMNNLAEWLLVSGRVAEALPLAREAARLDVNPGILDTLRRAEAANTH